MCSRGREVIDGTRRKCHAGNAKEMKEMKISSQSENEASNPPKSNIKKDEKCFFCKEK